MTNFPLVLLLLVLGLLVLVLVPVLLMLLLQGQPWKASGLIRWQMRFRREQQGWRFPAHEARPQRHRPQLWIPLYPTVQALTMLRTMR